MKKPAPNVKPRHVVFQDGRYYWKPPKGARPAFTTTPLGERQRVAYAEGERLNRQLDDWRKDAANRKGGGGRSRRPGPYSVKEILTGWFSARPPFSTDRARENCRYMVARLEREFGHDPAALLDYPRVDEWARDLARTSPETARHMASVGRSAFAWAGRQKMIPDGHNPFAKIGLGSGNKRKVRIIWDDVRALVVAAAKQGYPSIGVALATGFLCVQRVYDLWNLTRANIVREGNETRLKFIQSKGTRVDRNGRQRDGFGVDMILPDIVADLLQKYPPTPTKEGFLFVCETTGKSWHEKTAARVFRRIVNTLVEEQPKLKHLRAVQLRDARRSGFVQYMMDTNSDVAAVCSISGHTIEEGMSILEHYNPKTPQQADSAVARLSVRL